MKSVTQLSLIATSVVLLLSTGAWNRDQGSALPHAVAVVAAVAMLAVVALSIWRGRRKESGRPPPASDARVRELEAKLRESEARLHRTVTGSRQCYGEWDLTTGKVTFSGYWEGMLGYSHEKMAPTYEAWAELLHPEDRPAVLGALEAHVMGRIPVVDMENRMRTKSGEWKWVLSHALVVERAPDGRPLRVSGTFSDIHARKLAEAVVVRQVAFYAALNATTLELLNRRDQAQLLQSIAERAAALLDAPHVELALIEGDVLVTRAYSGQAPGVLGERATRDAAVLSWRAVDSRQPVVIDRYDTLPGARAAYLERGAQAIGVFPILHGTECLGVLALVRQRAGHSFDSTDLQQGQLLAQLVALVLHNATIYNDAVREVEAHTASLRESEERTRQIIDTALDAVITMDAAGRITGWNPQAVAIFGWSAAEAIGRPLADTIIPPALRQRHETGLRAHLSTGITRILGRRLELSAVHRDGHEIPVELTVAPVTVRGERHFSAFVRDLTEQRAAEAAHGRTQKQFQDLFDFAPDAILMVDHGGRIVRANRRAETLFGYTSEEFIGQPIEILVPDAQRGMHRTQREQFAAAPKARQMGAQAVDLQARRKDGSVFPAEISLGPVESEGGLLVAAAVRDITAQRQAEARLRQTQKIESLGTLAGGIAHDFNNILTGMLGYVELARMDLAPDDPSRQWLDNIVLAGARAKSLVQQILTFSRQTESLRTLIDLRGVTAEALRLLRSTLPPMVRIEQSFASDCPAVFADASQLHQVVMNLCTNAWHALPERGGVITVAVDPVEVTPEMRATQADLPAGRAVRLSVTDNGCGMPPDVLERIFDPFYTTKPAGKGTGLGLAVVHGVVRAHHGAIIVRSKPSVGTTFEIYLPARVEPVPDSAAKAELPRGHGQRILLVDDDSLGRTALAAQLGHLGYQVEHFEKATDALARFAQQPRVYAALITDFAMPDITGAELARRARAQRADIPVLVISGHIDSTRQRQLELSHVTELLQKPPSLSELAAAVARCVQSGHAGPTD